MERSQLIIRKKASHFKGDETLSRLKPNTSLIPPMDKTILLV